MIAKTKRAGHRDKSGKGTLLRILLIDAFHRRRHACLRTFLPARRGYLKGLRCHRLCKCEAKLVQHFFDQAVAARSVERKRIF
jgi:hypothetical protein